MSVGEMARCLPVSGIEAKVLSAVRSSVSTQRAKSITLHTRLWTEALIDSNEYHGIIHDLGTEIDFSLSPDEAASLYQENPMVSDLVALVTSKVRALQPAD